METRISFLVVVSMLLACQQQAPAEDRHQPELDEQMLQLTPWTSDGPLQLPLVEIDGDGDDDALYGGDYSALYGPDCDDCFADPCCTDPCYVPGWTLFGEFLYLRPRDAEVVYAIPIDAIGGNPPIQVGPTGLVDPDYEPGFRVGFSFALDECSELRTTYTHFESQTFDEASASAPYVLRSMVLHPSSANAATDWLRGSASYDVDFDLADLDYRRILSCGPAHVLNYLVGVRYAGLQQDFGSVFTSLGDETVETRVGFDGGGIRVGLDGERHIGNCGFMLYGRAAASFVAGDFRARYTQQQLGVTIVDTTWKAGRVVSMLDLELGFGWTSPAGRYRLTGGYVFSGWYNTVKTGDYIRAVQANDFAGLGDTMTFDGLVVRAELRF